MRYSLSKPANFSSWNKVCWAEKTTLAFLLIKLVILSNCSKEGVWHFLPLQQRKVRKSRRRISFQVMEAAERDRISGELQQLETELVVSGATIEEIILAKANYFAEKDLWSDTLQQLSSLETATGNVIANTQEMISYICQSEPAKPTK